MGYVEMKWHCDYCNSENWGRDRSCVHCGHARDEDVEFYLPTEKRRHETIETTNPDWVCSYCDTLNKATLSECEGCGASRSESKGDYFSVNKAKKMRKKQFQDSNSSISQPEPEHHESQVSIFSCVFDWIMEHIKVIGGAVGGLLLLFLLIWIFTPKPVILSVDELSWERSIDIEEERTVREEDWSIPAGGREISSTKKIHHYDKVVDHYETVTEQKSREVLDHYETVSEQKSRQVVDHYEDYVSGYRDLGNGYAEEIMSQRPVYKTEYYTETHDKPVYRTEYYTESHEEPVYKDIPVYKTWYTYNIEKWFDCRSVDTSGRDKNPYWGTVELADKEREGIRFEKYYVTGINKKNDERVIYTVSYDLWNKINTDTIIKVKVSLNHITELEK